MADCMCSLPLQQFISTVDTRRLPIVIQVCSGIYFQGSVYELSGSEVCFSTGDLVKMTGLTLTSVTCEDTISGERTELSLNHEGLFKPVGRWYQTLEDMHRAQETGEDLLPFTFISRQELSLDALGLGPGTLLEAFSVEPKARGRPGKMLCRLKGAQGSVVLGLPLSCRGEFHRCFSLRDIVSARLCGSSYCSVEAPPGAERPLVFSPVFEVEARMTMRREAVRFPSSLEVDVVEVSDQEVDTSFISPLTLEELLSLPDHTFPTMARILETPKDHLVCSGWVRELRQHEDLVLHGKASVPMALFSSARRTRRQYFLVSEGYGGRFRRRPREFLSVFEIYVAATQEPGLRVSVTRLSPEAEEHASGLLLGEELEVVDYRVGGQEQPHLQQNADVLICRRVEEPSEEEEEEEEEGAGSCPASIELPLFLHGTFRELISNNKKYKIKDLCQQFSPPLSVKVVSGDGKLASDPLYGVSSLRLEGVTAETVIHASFPASPELCFTVPTSCLSMVLCLTERTLPWPAGEPPVAQLDLVTEVTEAFYLETCRLMYSEQPAPPRPPKRNWSLAEKDTPKPCHPEPLAGSHPDGGEPVDRHRKPGGTLSPPPVPMALRKAPLYTPTPSRKSSEPLPPVRPPGELQAEDSDHEYESADMMDTIRKMQEFIMY